MNIDNFNKLRGQIAASAPEHCDMMEWRCGSVMCIAGRCEHLMRSEGLGPVESDQWFPDHFIEEYLGITFADMDKLCYDWADEVPEEGWKAWMLQRLDDCIAAGKVVPWNAVPSAL